MRLTEEGAKNLSWHIEGRRWTHRVKGKSVGGATVVSDSTGQPGRLDLTFTSGPSLIIGDKWKGIYRLDGDELTICFDISGQNYPEKFVLKPNTPTVLWVLKRAKP
jgi:uncharacterized protein (TIGR03067 family)